MVAVPLCFSKVPLLGVGSSCKYLFYVYSKNDSICCILDSDKIDTKIVKSSQQLTKYLKVPRIRNLYDKLKAEYAKRGPLAHGWDHIYRDTINAIWIGEAEGADMDIVIPAILLHDISFLYDPHPKDHHLLGAKKCYEWLEDWSDNDKKKIAGCIKTHKGNKIEAKYKPQTLEEKVVNDADLLEKVGAIGVLQGVRSMSEFAAQEVLPEFKSLYNVAKMLSNYSKKRRLLFYTKTGKKLAARRGGNGSFRIGVFKRAVKELEEYER